MGLWDWLSELYFDALFYFGYGKKASLLFLGLDDAGKTTLLHLLKNNSIITHLPTLYPNSEELVLGNITFTTFDLGGHIQVRRVWKDYLPAADGIVFIVDMSDPSRFPEARKELESVLSDEDTANAPVLILANKIDKPRAVSEQEIIYALNIHHLLTGVSVLTY